jgi:membrane associated rhomboid family serine protease
VGGLIGQILTIGVSIVIATGLSYLISMFLVKINKKLIFALPILFAIVAALFWVLGLIDDSWGALGYLLFGSFAFIAAVGSLISSLLLWRKMKHKADENE